jgi:hypothetical protein
MATRDETMRIEEYLSLFQTEIGRAAEKRFKDKFGELVGELEILDDEFLRKNMGCGGPIEDVFEHLQLLTGRFRYCEQPQGFEQECEALYRDVEEAIGSIVAYRQSCGY